MYKLQKVIKSRFKQQIIDQSSGRGREEGRPRINVDDPNPDNLPGPLRICCKTIEQIDSFKVGGHSSVMDGTSRERGADLRVVADRLPLCCWDLG